MNNNFYNMNNIGKAATERNRRIQNQAASFLAEYNKSLKESIAAEENTKYQNAMSNARLSYSTGIARSKARVNNLTEEINYTVNSSIIGMTEMISQVVESALLLDESEFSQLNPTYKNDIREIVSGFLKEAEINENISNEDTLAIMEYVAKTLPSVREGKTLTEADLSNFISNKTPLEINRSIRNLSGDVSSRVATLMEKEQKKTEKIEKDIKRATNKAAKNLADEKDPSIANADEIIAALENGEMEVEDVDAMLQNGDISQDVYDKIVDAYMDHANGEDENIDAEPTSGELANQAQNPEIGEEMGAGEDVPMEDPAAEPPMDPAMNNEADFGAEVPAEDPAAEPPMDNSGAMAPATPSAMGMPKKQVQMLPDGTMNINIYENYLVRETPRTGLIESLAVNDAMNRLAEGKSYDPDLSIANAIMYVTITETMDAMGLMNIGDKEYSNIIAEAGGCANVNSVNIMGVKSIKNEKADVEVQNTKMANRAAEALNRDHIINETVLVSQYVPVLNNRTDANSIAERIRQKKLMREQNNGISNSKNMLID